MALLPTAALEVEGALFGIWQPSHSLGLRFKPDKRDGSVLSWEA